MTMLAGFEGFEPTRPQSKLAARVEALSKELSDDHTLSAAEEMRLEMARSLAASIDLGSRKRSIANEVEKLLDVLAQLTPEDKTNEGTLNAEDRAMLDALSGGPVLDPAPAGDPA